MKRGPLEQKYPLICAEEDIDQMTLGGDVTGIHTERSRGRRHVKCQAAVAAFHVSMASALNMRSVRREIRWGWSEKVL